MRIVPQSPLLRVVGAVLLASLAIFVYSSVQHMRAGVLFAKQWHTQMEARGLATAIGSYETEYNVPPVAKDNASLIRILVGNNPRGIPFLLPQAKDLNAKGELVDDWGRPFNISIDATGHSTVISLSMMHGKAWQPFDSRKLNEPSRMDDRPTLEPF